MTSNNSSSTDSEHYTHLCASPMKKPKKEYEILENDNKEFINIDSKFALKTLHDMWKTGEIFWNLGANVLMINPNRNINKSVQHKNKESTISNNMLSFINNITDNIKHSQQNQSYIALGAAGSGKTNTTTKIVSHLMSQNNSNTLNLLDLWNNISIIYKVFSSHCYGNNITSSGCAKIYKLIYERNGNLQGILCESLLWHKFIPSFNNSNDIQVSGYFHIFSMVINHPNYVNNTLTNSIKQNDIVLSYPSVFSDENENEYVNTFQEAMNHLMISTVKQKEIFDIIYSILCLKQIEFIYNSNQTSITINKLSLPFAKQICNLLQCQAKHFLQYLMTQSINTRCVPHVTTNGAYKKVQRLCCILYECIISWLFQHIDNLCLNIIDSEKVSHFISVIDFPGFKNNVNSNLDDFCTNFCNENMQQLFNSLILQYNQQLYIDDGLNWNITPISDYSKVIDLIASPPNGIFQIITKYKNDIDTMLQQIEESNPFKRQLISVSNKNECFTISHYHSNVEYDVKDFAFHNNCNIISVKNDDIIPLLNKSNLNIIKYFMESISDIQNNKNKVNKINFQIRNLIKVIKTTNINTILCINPSQNNIDAHFSRDYVLSQIKYLSIVETLRDSVHGYAAYIESKKLLNIYNNYCDNYIHQLLSTLTIEQKCEAILILFGMNKECYKFGLSKVFIKHFALKQLRQLQTFNDSTQLNSLQHKNRLMSYVQKIKMQKLTGLSKSYCRLNHRVQYHRVFESIKNVVMLQKLIRKASEIKQKSIPIFQKLKHKIINNIVNCKYDINDVLSSQSDMKIHLNNLFNNHCYYIKVNDNISMHINPYSFSNLRNNKYNENFIQNIISKIRKNMIKNNQSQSLILHGDNSSGKTTNFFCISKHIISICQNDKHLHDILWASNQILISFCHNSSIHNVNSSRYIILRKFKFDKNANLINIQQNAKLLSPFICKLDSNNNARNFHLFYQICNVLKNDSRFLLENCVAFSCLKSNINDNEMYGMNDNDQFVYFLRALKILNVSTSKQQQICRLCAAILHLSSIKADYDGDIMMEFEFSDMDKKYLFAASYLLGIEMDKLCDILLPKSAPQNKSQITMQILYQSQILIKSLYELLFEYINDIINHKFDEYFEDKFDSNNENTELLLVDMSGRIDENINNNRFSNLAANYTFDIIQNNINKQFIIETQNNLAKEMKNYIFVQKTHDHEQYSLNPIDNQKNGIISVLNYIQTHKYHKSDASKIFAEMFGNNKLIKTDETKFIINHYPYHILYNTQYVFNDSQSFEFDALIQLLNNSSLSIAHKLINFYSRNKLFNFGQSFGWNRINCVIFECFDYLFNNKNNININNNYMLCIRPNCNQDAMEWNSTIIEQQLKAFHIYQIINVHKNIMPFVFNLNINEIANKLSIVFGNNNRHVIEMYEYNPSLLIVSLFNVFDIKPSQYKIGKYKLFLCNELVKNKVNKLLNFNTTLPPIQSIEFNKYCVKTKINRIKNVLLTYIKLSNGYKTICYNNSKQYQRNAIKCIINYKRFVIPIIKNVKLKLEKERIEKEKENERLKQEKLIELRRLEMEKKKLQNQFENEKKQREKELKNLQKKWDQFENEKSMELARIEKEIIEKQQQRLHIIGSSEINNISIVNKYENISDLNDIIHNVLNENERKQTKTILKELYKYKNITNTNINPHNIFIKIKSLIKQVKPIIRYDLYKIFEELILAKHLKMYHILLKEIRKCSYNFKQIINAINNRNMCSGDKISAINKEKVFEICNILHSNILLDRNIVIQYLYELDGILKHLKHKDYIDIIALIEMIVNEHNLPMFVHVFQPLRAQKEFLTKFSFYFSEAMYKIFKILLDQMIDNIESENHNSNLDPIFRDLSKIFIKLPQYVNMDDIVSQFLLYFVPPQYVYEFHQSTRFILAKRYQKIQQTSPKNQNQNQNQTQPCTDSMIGNDHKLLKNLKQQVDDLRKISAENQQDLKHTIEYQLDKQSKQSKIIEDKINDLQNKSVNFNPQIHHTSEIHQINEDKIIQRVTKILDSKISPKKKIIINPKSADEINNDPYIHFLNECFDKFDPNKTDKIALNVIPEILQMLHITGNKKQTLIIAFNDMCKLTQPEIYRRQYLSVLLHTYHSSVNSMPPHPPPPPAAANNIRHSGVNKRASKIISFEEKKNIDNLHQIEDNILKKQKQKHTTPTVSELLKNNNCIHAWVMKKGDTFFKTNKKKFVILCDHIFYWCSSNDTKYPNGGLNLYSHNVHVTQHATILRIKSSIKERIFNFGDINTANKFYNKIVEQQNNKAIKHNENSS